MNTRKEARQMLNDLEGAWRNQQQERLRSELKHLWESAVEVTLIYYLRQADPDLDLVAAVPGLKVLVQEGDLYVVSVPKASCAALQALEDQGKVPSPTVEECRRLKVLAEAASKKN